VSCEISAPYVMVFPAGSSLDFGVCRVSRPTRFRQRSVGLSKEASALTLFRKSSRTLASPSLRLALGSRMLNAPAPSDYGPFIPTPPPPRERLGRGPVTKKGAATAAPFFVLRGDPNVAKLEPVCGLPYGLGGAPLACGATREYELSEACELVNADGPKVPGCAQCDARRLHLKRPDAASERCNSCEPIGATRIIGTNSMTSPLRLPPRAQLQLLRRRQRWEP
jgi:hypothetical protein